MSRILIAITFIALLAAGWLGWERISQQADRARLAEIQNGLNQEAAEIAGIESGLIQQAAVLDEIEGNLSALQDEIARLEEAHPHGIPENIYPAYQLQVARYNDLAATLNTALNGYNEIFEGYRTRVERYNEQVAEANALAESLGSDWTTEGWLDQLAGE